MIEEGGDDLFGIWGSVLFSFLIGIAARERVVDCLK